MCCRGREFYLPSPDLEAGSSGSERSADAGGGSGGEPASLAAVCSFVKAAGRALQEEQVAAAGGSCASATQELLPLVSGSSSWAVRAADQLLPRPAAAAAAAALATVRLRQLLCPKAAPSLGLAAALWLNGLALLAGGCTVGVVLLGRLLAHAIGGLCRLNIFLSSFYGLVPDCVPAYKPPAPWLPAVICACSALIVCEWQQRGRRGWAARLLLRLDAAAPRILLQLYLVAFVLVANMLLLAVLFNLGAIWAAWLRLADPPGHEAAWQHPRP